MASAEEDCVVVDGFTVIATRFNKKSSAGHDLYVKAHNVQKTDPCKPRERTLLVLNVPPYCDEKCLERVFSECGPILKVYLHKAPNAGAPVEEETNYFKKIQPAKGFKVGYIVFKDASSVQKATSRPHEPPLILATKKHPIQTGMAKWCAEYRDSMVHAGDMQREIDSWLADYDEKVEEEKRRERETEGVPDEEGWITVTKHGRNKGVPRTEAHEQKILAKEKKKRSQKELVNFYSFQVRESKKEHIAQLRQKFQEDKQRIALMKAQRKFKPY